MKGPNPAPTLLLAPASALALAVAVALAVALALALALPVLGSGLGSGSVLDTGLGYGPDRHPLRTAGAVSPPSTRYREEERVGPEPVRA